MGNQLAEQAFEAEVGRIIGEQEGFTVRLAVAVEPPGHRFQVARRVIQFLLIDLVEQVELVAVTVGRMQHAGNAHHQRKHPVAPELGIKGQWHGLFSIEVVEFRVGDQPRRAQQQLQALVDGHAGDLVQLARVALVELDGQFSRQLVDRFDMQVGDHVDL